MTRHVAVVVPVRDDPRLTRCLDALARQTLPPVEVVVVDDGSRRPVDPRPGVTVVRRPPLGSYAARNAGLEQLRARELPSYVAFTDADCLPQPTWLERAVAALEDDPSAAAVTGPIEVFPHGPRPGAVELYDALTGFPQREFVERWGFGATANLVVRRAALEAVGPFRDHLQSGGDAEWGERAAAAGHRTVFRDDVIVRHPARDSLVEILRKARRTTRGAEQLGRDRGTLPPWFALATERLTRPWRGVPLLRDGRLSPVDRVRAFGVAVVVHAVIAAEIVRVRAEWTRARWVGARRVRP